MCTGTVLPLAQWNILSCVSLGSKGTFHRRWKWRALRKTSRVSSSRDPEDKNSGMAPTGRKNAFHLAVDIKRFTKHKKLQGLVLWKGLLVSP